MTTHPGPAPYPAPVTGEPAHTADRALEIENLRRAYPRRKAPPLAALDGVTLDLPRGVSLALLGPNGAGKSTLMRIVATLDRPDSGSVRVLGHDPSRGAAAVRAVRERIGVVFQRHGLDPLRSVEENLVNQAALFGHSGADARARARHGAIDLGIADRLATRVGELSGGLARRVDLARALLHGPDLLLLDEPTAGLDHAARNAFLRALEQRRDVAGLTVVMSTHLMDEAERTDRVALIDRGRIVAEGAPDELRRSVGGLLLRTGDAHAQALESAGLTVRTYAGEAIGAGEPGAVLEAAQRLGERLTTGEDATHLHLGPPTLGDAYLALTGHALDGEGSA